MLLVDQTYHYQELGMGYGPWESHCRVRIFQPHPESTICSFQTVAWIQDLGYKFLWTFSDVTRQPVWLKSYPSYLDRALLPASVEAIESRVRFVQFLWEGKEAVHFCWKPLSQLQVESMAGCFWAS